MHGFLHQLPAQPTPQKPAFQNRNHPLNNPITNPKPHTPINSHPQLPAFQPSIVPYYPFPPPTNSSITTGRAIPPILPRITARTISLLQPLPPPRYSVVLLDRKGLIHVDSKSWIEGLSKKCWLVAYRNMSVVLTFGLR